MRSWFGPVDDVGNLINRKKYARAARVLRHQLAERPDNVHLRQRLADVFVLDGKSGEALRILDAMVDEFAAAGFDAKAIAVLKKMQRIDPDRREIEEKLAGMIKRRDREARLETPAVPVSESSADAEVQASRMGIRLPVVRRSPLFSTFSARELLAVIRGLTLASFEPGEVIVSEDEPGDSLFVLASGSVRIYVKNVAGRNQQIRMLEEGAFFGEISLLSGKPRSATITAAEPTEVLELDRQTLDAIVEQHPQVPEIIREVSEQRAMSPEEVQARGGG